MRALRALDRYHLALLGLVLGGTLLRVVVAFTTYGTIADVGNAFRVYQYVTDGQPFDLYESYPNAVTPVWPYPPGFIPWLLVAGGASELLPEPWGLFHGWLQLGPILTDGALAVLVGHLLGRAGASTRLRLTGAALVALGPIFAITSGFSHQIDSVAVLPALLGAALWDAAPRTRRRVLLAGALVGLGASVKSPLGLTVLVMLPTARTLWEALAVTAAAVAVPLVQLAPFLLHDPVAPVEMILGYTGAGGQAMLSAVLEPGLTEMWVTRTGLEDYSSALDPAGIYIALAIAAGVLAVGLRTRAPALELACVLWPAVWALGPGFFFHYLIWGLPFLLVAGRWRAALLIQVGGMVPLLMLGLSAHDGAALVFYRVWVYVLWVGVLVLLVRSVRALPRVAT